MKEISNKHKTNSFPCSPDPYLSGSLSPPTPCQTIHFIGACRRGMQFPSSAAAAEQLAQSGDCFDFLSPNHST